MLQTSNSSTTTLFYLAKNQDKQEKLREEIDRVLETKDTPITAAKLEDMKYLRACIKEAMRWGISEGVFESAKFRGPFGDLQTVRQENATYNTKDSIHPSLLTKPGMLKWFEVKTKHLL